VRKSLKLLMIVHIDERDDWTVNSKAGALLEIPQHNVEML